MDSNMIDILCQCFIISVITGLSVVILMLLIGSIIKLKDYFKEKEPTADELWKKATESLKRYNESLNKK